MCNTIGNVFRLCMVALVCLALAMQFFVTSGCSFLSTPKGYVGIWYVDDGKGNCVAWGSSQSQVVGGAQSALTISTIAGFAAGVMVLFEWLICEVCCAGCLEGLAFCTSWLIGGAVFMIYGISACGNIQSAVSSGQVPQNNGSCQWGTDATYMIVACASYFIAGFLLCCTPQPEPICKQ